MKTWKDEKTGETATGEVGEPEAVNTHGDTQKTVKNLQINGNTYNVGDLIDIAEDPDDWLHGEAETYKITRINETEDGEEVFLIGSTQGKEDIILRARKWKRISPHKFK